jgi:protein gp37
MASQRDGGVSWTNPPGYRGESWNVAIGCAERCGARCWAERQAIRQVRGRYAGLVESTPNGPRWTGRQTFVSEKLSDPLHWREPRCVAVSLMGDLFGSGITDMQIAAVYGVMAACPQHRFVVLTKQARRRLEWHRWLAEARKTWTYRDYDGVPTSNVIECVSCLNQATLDALVPDLLATPAACRGVSLEPLLSHVDVESIVTSCVGCGNRGSAAWALEAAGTSLCLNACVKHGEGPSVDWVIVGAESGTRPLRTKGARYCDQGWLLNVVQQCRDAGVACHVKQIHLGAPPDFLLSHDPDEWRESLRVRQWPEVFK